jgi:hypothetical protein
MQKERVFHKKKGQLNVVPFFTLDQLDHYLLTAFFAVE